MYLVLDQTTDIPDTSRDELCRPSCLNTILYTLQLEGYIGHRVNSRMNLQLSPRVISRRTRQRTRVHFFAKTTVTLKVVITATSAMSAEQGFTETLT